MKRANGAGRSGSDMPSSSSNLGAGETYQTSSPSTDSAQVRDKSFPSPNRESTSYTFSPNHRGVANVGSPEIDLSSDSKWMQASRKRRVEDERRTMHSSGFRESPVSPNMPMESAYRPSQSEQRGLIILDDPWFPHASGSRETNPAATQWLEMCETAQSSPSEIASSDHSFQTTVYTGEEYQGQSGHGTSNSFAELFKTRTNHSEIEKRRRDKMNAAINEIAQLIPVCRGSQKKLDKLTVLKVALAELKSATNNSHFPQIFLPRLSAPTSSSPAAPAALETTTSTPVVGEPIATEAELKDIILRAASGFVLTVECGRGKVLFASNSVMQYIEYSAEQLIGQNIFDFIHPNDINTLKGQLSTTFCGAITRCTRTSKSSIPSLGSMEFSEEPQIPTSSEHSSNLIPGARRAFFIRIKRPGLSKATKGDDYVTLYCEGYLKTWDARDGSLDASDNEENIFSCLTVVASIPDFDQEERCRKRKRKPSGDSEVSLSSTAHSTCLYGPDEAKTVPYTFMSRHTPDGKYVWVDPNAYPILGYLPQELLQSSIYEFCHPNSIPTLSKAHKNVLEASPKTPFSIAPCQLKKKNGDWIWIAIEAFAFTNTNTDEIEFFCAKNRIIEEDKVGKLCRKSVGAHKEHHSESSALMRSIGRSIAGDASSTSSNREDEEEGSSSAGAGATSQGGARGSQRWRRAAPGTNGGSTSTHPRPEADADLVSPLLGNTYRNGQRRTTDASVSSNGNNGVFSHRDNGILTSGLGSPTTDSGAGNGRPLDDENRSYDGVGGGFINDQIDISELESETNMAFLMQILGADAGLGGAVDAADFPWPWSA